MTEKVVLITGGAGFLGSHITRRLVQSGVKVVVIKRSASDMGRIRDLLPNVNTFDSDTGDLRELFKTNRFDAVIHTACHYGRNQDTAASIAHTNIIFALEVLSAAIENHVGSFINADTVLPKMLNNYSLSKSQFSEWLIASKSDIKVVNLKFDHLYGPHDDESKFVYKLIAQLRDNAAQVPLTSGVQLRDFIYVEDAANAFLKVFQNVSSLGKFSEFRVGSGESIAVRYFVETLKREFERMYGTVRTKLCFGALSYRQGEPMEFSIDSEILNLGWFPETSLNEGIRKTLVG